MFVKGIVVAVLLASTPIAYVTTQESRSEAQKPEAAALQRLQQEQRQAVEVRAATRPQLLAVAQSRVDVALPVAARRGPR